LQKHQSVLELGAGEGFFTSLISPDVRSIAAIDVDP
jgi:16S rRNA A1518/A1519 N6-dimethyltransferase RsmA/KsgA/DIM1 with predicted DNA glycosylase/AP lyase activity